MSKSWPAEGPWNNVPYWDQNYSGVQIIPSMVPQQPTIIQQIPSTFTPPLSHPIRPGRAKEDLIDLMMIQNAQMHQVIMNNMTMSALSNFGYGPTENPPMPSVVPVQLEEDDPVIYHHHYEPYPGNYPAYPSYPTWQPQRPILHPEPTVRHLNLDIPPTSPIHSIDQPAVPPPPPLSATGTVGADVPPASEYYDLAEGRI
ncbi:proline-rich protein 29 [Rhinophrynus dorsalis]